MTIEDLYLRFVNAVNRNSTNNNISVDKARFIQHINTATNRYITWTLEKRNEDDVRYISPLLVLNKPLQLDIQTEETTDFVLPTDYFDFSNLSVTATKGDCKKQKLQVFEVKSEDLEEVLTDENNKPSFEFRETAYLINSKNVSVFKGDFKIDSAKMTYYRYPVQVDISGYINSAKLPSTTIHPELDDKVLEKIIDIAAKDFAANTNDSNGYQLNKDRVNTKS